MKKIFSILGLSLLSAVLILESCSKGGTGGGGTPPPPPPPPPGNSLSVNVDKTQIFADGWETVVITVKDQNNNDVTSSSSIYLGNALLSNNSFWTSVPGTYELKASRSGITSPVVNITAVNPGASPFSQKILVEDYTGTWCGHCPRVGINLENYVATHPNTVVIANHGPSNDPYTFSSHGTLANAFTVTGYPSAWVDRDFKWSESNSQLDGQFTNRRPPLGLGFQTAVVGNTINVTAKVKFDVTTAVNLKLVAYLVEDGRVYPQVNYNYFGLPNPISGYVHNAILRKTGTDLFGDNIPTASQVKGTTYTKTLSFDATGYDISKCRIVAFVVQGPNSQNRKERAVLNIQTVNAGLDKDFD